MEYFQDPATQRFSFQSHAASVSQTTFAVLRFKGFEAISTPYQFDIMLVSGEADLDLSEILQSQAVFTLHRDNGDDVHYNGILAEFEQQHAYNGHYFYRARLVPKLWWLMQTQHNQVFLEQAVPEIIERALTDGGMDSLDYDLSALEGTYNPVEYVCHYHESHFNFISRWMEREGVYYYFYHDADGDRLILSDSAFSHEPMRQGADLVFSPITGMEQGHRDEIILDFTCRQVQLPHTIALKDHNPERPSLEMVVRADVDPNGRGESFIYGEHYQTPEEGERLVQFRAEELLCQKQSFYGGSTVPFLTPGFKFNLQQHYRDSFNQEYMVVEVTHEGDQTNLLKTSVIGSLAEDADINIYSNSFKAIPASVQYRHPRQTPQPKVSGTLHGKIDGEQDSPYAQLDEQGRYKVRLPFDINDEHLDGKASARIRMMQPYAGEGKGMQFPLTKGTEVLLTFIDGNPDRPLIAGAVSTETTPSPVNADNQSESVIRSAGNNRIRMEDRAGKERMVFQSAMASSWIRIGTPNDPIKLVGASPLHVKNDDETWIDLDPKAEVTDSAGNTSETTADWVRPEASVDDDSTDVDLSQALPEGIYIAHYSSGDDSVRRRIFAYDLDDTNHPYNFDYALDGIRTQTSGALWWESQDRYGQYVSSYPKKALPRRASDTDPSLLGDMLANFNDPSAPVYAPTGVKNYDGTDARDFLSVMRKAEVRMSSFDTVTTQEGNIYDFGGYWNYNLGNSYEEAHIDQAAPLNRAGSLAGSAKTDDSLIFGDILSSGGPNWASVNWITDKGVRTELPGDWDAGHVWTTKEFGNSYDFREGHAISVTNGSTLDISYTGNRSIELVMRKSGDPASWTHSEGGKTEEKKWTPTGIVSYESVSQSIKNGDVIIGKSSVSTSRDINTGGIQNYKAEATTGMATTSFEFDYSSSATGKIAFASSLALSISGSANIAVSMSASLNLSLEVNALELSLKAPFSGITVSSDYKGGAKIVIPGGSIEVEGPGPSIKVKGKAPEFEVSSLKAAQSTLKAEYDNIGLASGLLKMFG
ncbi:MAG: type VI secretion system Vgr family protein [Saccharospirillum sp.]